MPYVFAALVILNAGVFGYYALVHDAEAQTNDKIAKVESQLTATIEFQNTSKELPPEIGTKK